MQQTLSKEIFRAYDIRGIVDETLTQEDTYKIGRAFCEMLRQHDQYKVILARDGRLSSPQLHAVLLQSLLDSGCDVIDIGIVPTPVLYFATFVLGCSNGVMLTASHNPANYNGFKMMINNLPLLPEAIQEIYSLAQKTFEIREVKGKLTSNDILKEYERDICESIKLSKPLKIAIDCANGVASVIAPFLLRQLGCEVIELFCTLDGRFPNHAPDPSEIENLESLIHAVKEHQCDVGFAFDGDGDRVMVVDEKGKLIFPDYLLMLFATSLKEKYPALKVIHDVKCTRYLSDVIHKQGGQALMCRTGHSFMKIKMREEHAQIGGEASGHLFWKDRWYGVDDGLYTAARLLEVLSQASESLSSLMSHYPRGVETPEYKLPMDENKKNSFMKQLMQQADFPGATRITLDGLRVEFPFGWGLVRVSNTSPYMTFRFEADTKKELDHIVDLFRVALLNIDKTLVLPF